MARKSNKKATLKMLRTLYGYDMAVVKQSGANLGDETSELESLALYHLNKQIISAIEEFYSYTDATAPMVSGAVAVLMGASGEIIAGMEQTYGKKAAEKTAKFGNKYLAMQYNKTKNKESADD